MTFKAGISGNPSGRPKGAKSKSIQLTKLLEPYSQQLIDKVINLALDGDINALKVCIERLGPKAQRESLDIDLPIHFDEKNIKQFKRDVLRAVLEGRIDSDEAEKLIRLVEAQKLSKYKDVQDISKPIDPIEAAKIYQMIMRN